MDAQFSIHADGLTKRYGSETAVEELKLQISPGTVYGFLGPNGAGKTTTIRMLTTLLRPTSGYAHIAGNSIEIRDEVTPHIGYVPETPPLFDELTGREQLTYMAGLRDIPDQTAEKRITDYVETFELEDDADKRIKSYSKGMKQKVSFIQAILHEPAVVFLDEPSSGLDPRAARTVRDVISDLAAGNTTVFLSTHILPVVDELADQVGVLYDGELVAEGAPETLKQRAKGGVQTLEDVFLEVTSQDELDGTAADVEPQVT